MDGRRWLDILAIRGNKFMMGAGSFNPAASGITITKTENFRSSKSVINFLNAFRKDVKQYPVGENANRDGSVLFRLVKSEPPALPRNRYSEEQIDRALARMDQAITEWGWGDNKDMISTFFGSTNDSSSTGLSFIEPTFYRRVCVWARPKRIMKQASISYLSPSRTSFGRSSLLMLSGDSRKVIDLDSVPMVRHLR